MPEQTQKLIHFTQNVLKAASKENEELSAQLEGQRKAVLDETRKTALDSAKSYYVRESARLKAEAGREVSKHLMEGRRAIYLRRKEVGQEVLEQVRVRVEQFVASPEYPGRLRELLAQALARLDGVENVTLRLRREDLPLGPMLAESAAPVKVRVEEAGHIAIGGLSLVCPEVGMRVDCSFDTQLEELGGHFAEIFGLSLSDDLNEN